MKTFLKRSLGLMAVAVLAFAAAPPTQGQQAKATFAGTSTDIGATNTHFIVSANGIGHPVITFINATSDKAGSVLQFRVPSAAVQVTHATNGSQAVIHAAGSFSGTDVVVVRRRAADTYERLVVSSATATNITFASNLSAAVAVGDVVYKMGSNGTIPVGSATKEVTSQAGIYHAPVGTPVLIDLDSTSAGQINLISGYFRRGDFP